MSYHTLSSPRSHSIRNRSSPLSTWPGRVPYANPNRQTGPDSSTTYTIRHALNPTVVRDTTALEVFPVRPMGIREAIQKALTSSRP
jgi:hypothetical protein